MRWRRTGGDLMSATSSILLAPTATNGDAPIGLLGACAIGIFCFFGLKKRQ